jgi:simple sugar transport system permease protein
MPRWFDALGSRLNRINSVVLTLLAVVSALVVGVFVIVLSDVEALQSGDFGRAFSEVANAYKALVTGSVGSLRAISDTINNATPFIITGVSVAVAFRAGLFNIGATGQMIAGGTTATWVGFAMDGPGIVQIPLALLAGILGGAAFGAIPGVLKARTGAHEVITTIMLNYIASFMLLWLLTTDLFQRPERTDPISKFVSDASRLPTLFGFMEGRADLTAHSGILLALLVVVLFWWFLERSKMGFEFRAFGMNADAAEYAGMRAKRLTVLGMVVAGGIAGLAGAVEILGRYGYATQSFAGTIGFDAIAIALLGRSTPLGTLLAALLFGALQSGGRTMQATTEVPIDLIVVLRALIVMFIAAPLLVKAIWRVKSADVSTGQTFKGWGS